MVQLPSRFTILGQKYSESSESLMSKANLEFIETFVEVLCPLKLSRQFYYYSIRSTAGTASGEVKQILYQQVKWIIQGLKTEQEKVITQQNRSLKNPVFKSENIVGKRMEISSANKRLIGLDLFRITAAAIVLAFHSYIHFGCTYGILNRFIQNGAVMMTGFFMMSGFSLHYVYANRNFGDGVERRRFYVKRMVGIMPGYYFVALLYIVFIGRESIIDNIILLPMEAFGLQSIYPGTFIITHNGGTWFISCIIFCYIMFPFMEQVLGG